MMSINDSAAAVAAKEWIGVLSGHDLMVAKQGKLASPRPPLNGFNCNLSGPVQHACPHQLRPLAILRHSSLGSASNPEPWFNEVFTRSLCRAADWICDGVHFFR